ncbi:MAG: formate/nitrite transporter family protein [Prevotella sp.]|nr:formate/nitrite transporter family protein [Staphylococcus sp.]MCM1349801.1 formate/nitrite transporter family protein [Prevotella sp.]
MNHLNKQYTIYLSIFIKGIFAGICIAIGGLLYIQTRNLTSNLVLAAFLFPVGLILICNFGFFLYTGKICYAFERFKMPDESYYPIQLLLGLIGNYVGALLMGWLFRNLFEIPEFVETMIATKMSYSWWKLLLLGICCGVLIYFAVEGFAKIENPIGKYVVLMLCIGGFILCGFEHCVANMFYFSLDKTITLQSVSSIFFVVIGNSIGGFFIPLCKKIIPNL